MKKFLYFVFMLSVYSLQASWIIVQVDNKTDLNLVQAVRQNNIEIDAVSQIFQNSSNKKSFKIPADLLFGSLHGCGIVGKSLPGDMQATFLFLADPTYRVANGRASFADLDSRNAAAGIKQSMMARVFAMQQGVMKLIGSIGFDQDGQRYRLIFTGSLGDYQVQLIAVK